MARNGCRHKMRNDGSHSRSVLDHKRNDGSHGRSVLDHKKRMAELRSCSASKHKMKNWLGTRSVSEAEEGLAS
jgi:hypothetical protein